MVRRALVERMFQRAVTRCRADHLLEPFADRFPQGQVRVLAIGKAACAMAEGASKVLGGRLVSGLAITGRGYGWPVAGFRVLEAGHPIPDSDSLAAGEAALDFARATAADETLVGLVSGGASAVCEVLREGETLASLREATLARLRGGESIDQINAWRKSVSRIKAGGLARATSSPRLVFVLSDVSDDDPAVVGSGPFCAEHVPHITIGNPATLVEAAVHEAQSMGFHRIMCWPERLDFEAADVGVWLARAANTLSEGQVLLAIGEPTVTVRGTGRGGRACEAVCAAYLSAHDLEGAAFLAAGSDGMDGLMDFAGAAFKVEDDQTLDVAQARRALANHDTGTWAEKCGLAVHATERRSPTGTNLGDLFVVIR